MSVLETLYKTVMMEYVTPPRTISCYWLCLFCLGMIRLSVTYKHSTTPVMFNKTRSFRGSMEPLPILTDTYSGNDVTTAEDTQIDDDERKYNVVSTETDSDPTTSVSRQDIDSNTVTTKTTKDFYTFQKSDNHPSSKIHDSSLLQHSGKSGGDTNPGYQPEKDTLDPGVELIGKGQHSRGNLTWLDIDLSDKDSSDDDSIQDEDDDDDDDDEDNELLPTEQKLMNMLMRYYEKSVRPVRNASDTVLVRMGLTLTQIFDLEEKNQVLVTNVWLDQEWDDMFLTWDPNEYGGLKVLRLPCTKLWLPDIVLYNNAAEYTDGLMPANAMITYRGEVFWPVPTKLQSTCKVDVTYFPFDEQKCKLKFGSWTYDGFQVDMTNRTSKIDLSNYVKNGEWELVDILIQRNVVYYACCPEPFPDVTFTIHIRRRTIYYLYNVIFPCVMMSALTLLVFCLPPDSGEKITLGITVLLAFSVFLLRMGEDLPETSEFIPLLSIYLTIVMGLTSVSVIMTVFVLNLHYRGPNESQVPKWLRNMFIRHRLKRGVHVNRRANSVNEYITDNTRFVKNVSMRMTIENLAQELKEELDNNCPSDSTCEVPVNTEFQHYSGTQVITEFQTAENSTSRLYPGSYVAPPPPPPPLPSHSRTNKDILDALKKIITRYERDDNETYVMYEWQQVAVGVDRILFWIFFVGTVTSTVIVLIVAPLIKWF